MTRNGNNLSHHRTQPEPAAPGDERVCPVCGASLAGTRKDARFCSAKCRNRRWHQEHREEYDEWKQRHRQEHREEYAERDRRYYREHREEVAERKRRWCQEHPEKVAEQNRRYRQEHREEMTEYLRQWRQEHPEERRNARYRRRALKMGAGCVPFDVAELWESSGKTCVVCGDPIDPTLSYPDPMSRSLEHLIPLSQGGTHSPDNCGFSHLVCNLRKGAKTLEEVKTA